ncbi:CBS domain-containing protein [Wenjunlia tyrosinilytica]|uniref:CBS domain-containing protein n=1 Tax=Wenjunlia tyrosinilytica TaxID=1544741 RepID=A0A918DYH6_9ACTN|nr:CBS domain-containing protein [Wenjunlia tyrosinilytica]GGO92111.1 hypothetical protein GCM10012280_41550 [Wenjunlia tyrosinilytica]
MKQHRVGTVMAPDVVRVTPDTTFKEVAEQLARHRISGLPVVDDDEKVLGVVSETDLVLRQAAQADAQDPPRRRMPWRGRSARRKAATASARTAEELMSAPAVTVHAEDTIVSAARTMARHSVERLPVLDEEDRLVGIVTRRELLRVFLRADEDIRGEVIGEVLVKTLSLTPGTVEVTVDDGVVEVSGRLERRSEIPILVRLTSQVDGVVDVVDHLSYRHDDTHTEPTQPAMHGVADDWLRRL